MKRLISIIWLFAVSLFTGAKDAIAEHFDKADRALSDRLHYQASALSHYDENLDENLDDFEAEESYAEEFEEHYDHFRKRGNTPKTARRMAATRMNTSYGSRWKTSKGKRPPLFGGDKYNSAATFDLQITRMTANLAGVTLPVPLFGYIHYTAAYAALIGAELPAGVTLSGITSTATYIQFSYTDGVGTDNVRVSCNQIGYISFLVSTLTDLMAIKKTRYQISDITHTEQFSQIFKAKSKTLFGKLVEDAINPGSYKDPKQFQNGIVDIDQSMSIDKESGIVIGIIPVASFTVTLSCFIQKFSKRDAAGL